MTAQATARGDIDAGLLRAWSVLLQREGDNEEAVWRRVERLVALRCLELLRAPGVTALTDDLRLLAAAGEAMLPVAEHFERLIMSFEKGHRPFCLLVDRQQALRGATELHDARMLAIVRFRTQQKQILWELLFLLAAGGSLDSK